MAGESLSPLKLLYGLAAFFFFLLVTPFFRFHFFILGLRWLYILLFSFLLSALLTPVMAWLARRWGILDIPDARSVHEKSTPLLGGLAIMIAFCSSLLANMVLDREMLILLGAGIIVGSLGLLDDWRGISAKLKLLVQVVVVLFLTFNGIVLDLFPPQELWGTMGNLVLTLIWILGITNAMNFFDGMDGLATGLSAIMAIFMGIVSFETHQPTMGWIAIGVVGSCLGFFPHNFRPKKPAAIFLGDAGSTFLGFMLAGLAIQGYWSENSLIVSFATPVLIFWILIFDMTYITAERIITGKVRSFKEWIEYVGKDHLHHRLYALLGSKRKAVLLIFILSAALGLSSIALRNARTVDSILLVFQAFLVAAIFSMIEYAGRKNNHGRGP